MKIKEIKIKDLIIKNNLFLAPLAGFSDSAMRVICKDLGAGLCFTEMVSCKGLKYSYEKSKELLHFYNEEGVKAVQIFGSDSKIVGEIASSSILEPFDVIDINMGCPMPKIYNNKEGSYLLNDLKTASKIISSVAKSGKPTTVKFRIGITENNFITSKFAKMCEDSGANLITIHGRVKDKIYSGPCNYEEIAKAKSKVKIPVIANGGIFSKEDADLMMERTGADGVMIARGAIENPLIFCEILNEKPPFTLKECIIKHLNLLVSRYGSERSAVIFRKQMSFYLKGVYDSKKFKERVFSSKNSQEVLKIVEDCF